MKSVAFFLITAGVVITAGLDLLSPRSGLALSYTFQDAEFEDDGNQNITNPIGGLQDVSTITGTFTNPTTIFDPANAIATSFPADITTTIFYNASASPSSPSLQAPNHILFYNRVGLYQVTGAPAVSRFVFFCAPPITTMGSPCSDAQDQILGDQTNYQMLLEAIGDFLNAPPLTVALQVPNIGNIMQICADYGGALSENNCGQGENARVELSDLEGNLVETEIPAPLPIAGSAPLALMLRKLSEKRRLLLSASKLSCS